MDMLNYAVILADSSGNPFDKVAAPVVTILNWVVWPILSILSAVGIIYAIIIGVRMAKADSPQEREEAKKKLINAAISVVVIFVLMVIFPILMNVLGEWAKQENPDLIPDSGRNAIAGLAKSLRLLK